MPELPAGTVTFLFTDIEGSTRLLHELGDAYADALAEHRRALRDAFARNGGVEVDTQGDAFFVAFARASDALAAAREGQMGLAGPVRVRMGVHTGEPLLTDEGYVGMDVHRAARIAGAGHGGQILVSQSTRDLAGANDLRDLGEHRLKDLTAPERVYQLGDGEFPPLKSLNQSNLPTQPTALVGRERELEQVLDLMRASRLLTLTGTGGSGKTRLALQAAAELVDEFPEGVWFVSLAALTHVDLVLPTIAAALGTKEDIMDYLQPKRLLLVLDNVEQLLPEAAPRIARLLDAANVKALATSRERLALSAEQEYAVPTLPLDEAVALFIARAHGLDPSFEPDEYVREIARRLGGLPLALELAAARVKVLSSQQICERLGHSLDLLTGGARDLPERQRTLRATIAWSDELLTDAERVIFGRFALFAGSFDVEAAEVVCGCNLDTLGSLVDKSLLRRAPVRRFFMLETIREYALERLSESGEEDELRRRHAEHFTEVAETAHAHRFDLGGPRWLDRLEKEHDNLRLALEWIGARDPEWQIQLVGALGRFWSERSHLVEGRHRLESALEKETHDRSRRARALLAAGLVASAQHDMTPARSYVRESLEISRELGDTGDVATALNALAITYGWLEPATARRYLEESLELRRSLGDPLLANRTMLNLCMIAVAEGDFDDAEARAREVLAIAADHGDEIALLYAWHFLGDCALSQGDCEGACRRYRRSLELALNVGHRDQAATELMGFAMALAGTGRAADALRLAGAVDAFKESLGGGEDFPFWRGLKKRYLGRARRELGMAAADAASEEGRKTEFDHAARAVLEGSS
jgi:predicted ATPase/Tfp pilus assembly protein PilF